MKAAQAPLAAAMGIHGNFSPESVGRREFGGGEVEGEELRSRVGGRQIEEGRRGAVGFWGGMSGEEGGEGEDMIVMEEGNGRRESDRLRSG